MEYERYDQLLYDRYQMDAATGIPRPNSLAVLEEFELSHANVPVDYISLTAEAKKVFKNAPGYAVQSWLRGGNTIAFLHYWELRNNINFNVTGYETLLEELKSPSSTLTAKSGLKLQMLLAYSLSKGRMEELTLIQKLPVRFALGFVRNSNIH